MQFRHQRPDAATSREVFAPMDLVCTEGAILKVRSFRLDGIRLHENFSVPPRSGTLTIPFQGYGISVPVELKPSGHPDFLHFENLTARSDALLRYFHHSILTGEMVSAQDVITRLDTPVDLVPMGQTEEESAATTAKTKSRSLRALMSVLIYTLLFLLVFGLIGHTIWSRLNRIEILSAQVIAPGTIHTAASQGYVTDILVSPGDEVQQGDLLVAVSNPDAEAEVERVRGAVSRAEDRVATLQRLHSGLLAELAPERAALEAELRLALAERRTADFLGHYDMERVLAALAALKAMEDGLLANRPVIFVQAQEVEQQLADEVARLGGLRRELGDRKDIADSQDIIARSDGVVSWVDVYEGQFLVRTQPVVRLESDAPRSVLGFVGTDRNSELYVGMSARLRVRTAEGYWTVDATVVAFDAPEGYEADDDILQPVLITPDGLSADETRRLMVPGTPVAAHVKRRLQDRFLHWVGLDGH